MTFVAKNWWKILILLLTIVVAAGVRYLFVSGFVGLPGSFLRPAPAPDIKGKIKGYWSSEGAMAFSDLDDAAEMKEIGINTITFSPPLSHDQEGRIRELPGSETYVKRTINKAHKAGLRVMLETTPMNAGKVDPKVTNPKLFQDEMTRIAVKYADIANEYNVEYFAPIVEPVHHMSVQEADEWLHELLPKLKKVYGGLIMWKKQSNDLEHPKEWNQDHIFNLRFKPDGTEMKLQLKTLMEHSIALTMNSYKASLEEYSKNNSKFSLSKKHSLLPGWHDLKVEIGGNLITISIDGEKLFEKTDDTGPTGGYIISSPMRINKLEITDLAGEILYKEGFKSLNSWSARNGIKLERNEIVLSSNDEARLIHDINFSGYDYIAIDTFHRGRVYSIDEYVGYLEYVIQKTNDQAKTDGVPYVILAEFGGSTRENIGWKDVDERAKIPLTEQELAETTQRVLEAAENTVDGYMYNGWNIKGQGINKIPAVKKVIKDWYLNH